MIKIDKVHLFDLFLIQMAKTIAIYVTWHTSYLKFVAV